MPTWAEVENHPDYQVLNEADRLDVKKAFWQNQVISHPDFQSLSPQDQTEVQSKFFGPTQPEAGIAQQFAAGFIKTLPGRLTTLPARYLNPPGYEKVSNLPLPESIPGKVARGAGGITANIPLYAAGSALGGAGAGAIGLGPTAADIALGTVPKAVTIARGAGMFALPSGVEQAEEVAYGKPAGEAIKEVGKEAVTGGLFGIASTIAKPAQSLLAQWATLAGARAALENRKPTTDELILSGIFVGGMQGLHEGAKWLGERENMTPVNIFKEAQARADAEGKTVNDILAKDMAGIMTKTAPPPQMGAIGTRPLQTPREKLEAENRLRAKVKLPLLNLSRGMELEDVAAQNRVAGPLPAETIRPPQETGFVLKTPVAPERALVRINPEPLKLEELERQQITKRYKEAIQQRVKEAEARIAKPGEVTPAIPATARVKMMITQADEANLGARGFTQEQINKMKPEEAEQILSGEVAPVTPVIPPPLQAGVATTSPKEPWQMTKAEFIKQTSPKEFMGLKVTVKPTGESMQHFYAVRNALAEGKPVPSEVLKDYPDLKPPLAPAEAQPRGAGYEAKPAGTARLKMMITRADEANLKAKGFTQEQINKMTPEEAGKILESGEVAPVGQKAEPLPGEGKPFAQTPIHELDLKTQEAVKAEALQMKEEIRKGTPGSRIFTEKPEGEAPPTTGGLWTVPPEKKQATENIKEAIAQGETPKTFSGRMYAKWVGFWNPFALTPESDKLMAGRGRYHGALMVAGRASEESFNKLRVLPKDVREGIFDVADGTKDINTLPTQYQKLATEVIETNKRLGRELVDSGIITEEQYAGLQGKYVKYLYLRHLLGEEASYAVASGKLSLDEAKSRIKDWGRVEQEAFGLIKDISVAQPYYIREAMSDIATSKYFQFLADNPKWVWDKSFVKVPNYIGEKKPSLSIGQLEEKVKTWRKMAQEMPQNQDVQNRLKDLETIWTQAMGDLKKVPEGFVQAPKSKAWGALNGAYIRKEILEDLKPIYSITKEQAHEMLRWLTDLEAKGMAIFKMGKVAWNLPAAVRNTVSNVVQLNISPMPLWKIPGYIKRAGQSMLAGDAQYESAFWDGLFEENMPRVEIQGVLNEAAGIIPGRMDTFYKKIVNLSKYYGKIDDVFKFAKYLYEIDKGTPHEKAIMEARKWGMDYSLVSPSVKIARRHLIPFGTYQYKILPLVYESLRNNPWTLAKYMAIPPLLAYYAKDKWNLSEDDWQRVKRQLPLYIRNAGTYAVLPWRDEKGRMQWVNLEYFFPLGNVLTAQRDIRQRQFGNVPEDIGVLSNPYLTLAIALKTGADPFTKQPIFNELDAPSEKLYKSLLYTYSAFAPPMLTPSGAAGYTGRAVSQEVDRYGRRVTPVQAGARWLGVNILTPSREQTALQLKAKAAELRKELYRIEVDPQNSREKKRDAKQRYQQAINDLYMTGRQVLQRQ